MRMLYLFIGVLLGSYGHSQVSSNPSDVSSSRRMIPMTSLGITENKEDVQERFLRQEWSAGIVLFKNSPDRRHVPLIFDVYSNKLYFLHEKEIMEFIDTVAEFTMTIPAGSGDSNKITFRCLYPPIHKNTSETFYEVMVDGKFQLLKCKAKTIYQYKEQDIPEEERRYNRELLYAFFPGRQMILVKKDREQFLAEVPPEYIPSIKTIIESKKLKLKKEDSLKQLFLELNGEN